MANGRKHELLEALDGLLPHPDRTLLLRGCVLPGEPGEQALRAWFAAHLEPERTLSRSNTKWLLPLIYHAARSHGLTLPSTFGTILKTATLHEELRTQTFRKICSSVLNGLSDHRLDAVVLKGTALADAVYPQPALRHSHDIELLVAAHDLSAAAKAIASTDPAWKVADVHPDAVHLVHRSGLPLVLRSQLFQVPFLNGPIKRMRDRAVPAHVAGTAARILSPPDMLVHCCGEAVYSRSRDTLRWAADIWFLASRQPADLDPKYAEVLIRTARDANLLLPVLFSLEYVAAMLDAPLSRALLESLASSARGIRPLDTDAVLSLARCAPGGGYRRMLKRTTTLRGRLRLLRWMLAPSYCYLAWVNDESRFLPIAFEYFRRPVRYAIRCFKTAVRRRPSSLPNR